jgi:acyl carrier protein
MDIHEQYQNQILDFLSKHLLIPKEKINLTDSLFHDLGVDGDDASDLLKEYSKSFNVSLVNFNINKYFGPEGTSLINIIYELFTRHSFKTIPRLTVQDLIIAVNLGWLE